MRVWDLPPSRLCRQHLLAEHRELHAIWSILTKGKRGYSFHPEVLRWKNKLKALYKRHEALAAEFKQRGYKHETPLDARLAKGAGKQNEFVNTLAEQKKILRAKHCKCKTRNARLP